MDLTQIAVFSGLAALYAILIPARLRAWTLLIISLVAVYWMQPALPIRRVDFLLPSLTIGLAVLIWISVKPRQWEREDKIALAVTLAVIIGISLTRYLISDVRPTPSRPPAISLVMIGLGIFGLLSFLWAQIARRWVKILIVAQVLILILFIFLKTESLAEQVSAWLREIMGQNVDLANPNDIRWLGFSYVAFRLLHILRDAGNGRLPEVNLRQHLTFALFFPAFTAGPIDRIERHLEDDRSLPEMIGLDALRVSDGLQRIAFGIFKKFVVADTLALISLNATNAEQATSTSGLWVLLYAYAIRLYLDFSGYSDIAIGIGKLFGINLPENFNLPYFKHNITLFWQSWHITLSDWVRFYVFSPLSRSLLRRKPKPSPRMIVFISQMATMLTIGLWHGVTVNFLIWGAWHGLGLFAHKVWTDRTRTWYMGLNEKPRLKTAWTMAGIFLTFHFVVLGWVWFGLADFDSASQVFVRLFGL